MSSPVPGQQTADKNKLVGAVSPNVPDPDATEFVRIVSVDGHVFLIDRQCACVSTRIKHLLAGTSTAMTATKSDSKYVSFNDNEEDPVIQLKDPFDHKKVEKLCQYFYYKHRYDNDPDRRPPFDVPEDMAVDLMRLALELQC
jgi:transcription elongation factor B subunit 1